MELRLVQEGLFPQPSWNACRTGNRGTCWETLGDWGVCHLDFSDRYPWSVSIFKAVVFVHEVNAAVCESVCFHDTVNNNFREEVKLNAHRTEAQLQGSMTPSSVLFHFYLGLTSRERSKQPREPLSSHVKDTK